MAEQVSVVDAGAARGQRWKKIVHAVTSKTGVGASNIATSVAVVANVRTVVVDGLNLFNPRMGTGRAKDESNGYETKNELHFDF